MQNAVPGRPGTALWQLVRGRASMPVSSPRPPDGRLLSVSFTGSMTIPLRRAAALVSGATLVALPIPSTLGASAPVRIVVSPPSVRVGQPIDVRATVRRGSICEVRIGRGATVSGRSKSTPAVGTTFTSRLVAPAGDGARTLTVACGSSAAAVRSGSVRTSRRGILLRPVVALAAVRHGIVDINTRTADGRPFAAGTGMVLTPTGEILTNDHVIRGGRGITVTDVSTGTVYPASVVGYDTTNDVAVLQVQGAAALSPVALGDSSKVTVGAPVSAVGNANGAGGTPTVASGKVTKLHQSIDVNEEDGGSHRLRGLIQTDAFLQSGESGGPLFDETGQVVGMNTAGSGLNRVAATNEGFAIPINNALAIVRQIETGTESATVHIGSTGFLGISIPRSASNRAVVARVTRDSPASAAGLKRRDLVTSFDAVPVATRDELITQIHRHHAGDVVSITWADGNGASRTATVTLSEGAPG